MGGTFDPPHIGHLLAAQDAQRDLMMDEVLFMVAKDPWQKSGTVVATEFDRLVMTDLAVEPYPWASVSTIEIDREGPTYTIDTLEQLQTPGTRFWLIMGNDQYKNMHTWHRSSEIPDLALPYPILRWLSLSSTIIRSRVAAGKTIRGLVADPVADYIERLGLYAAR